MWLISLWLVSFFLSHQQDCFEKKNYLEIRLTFNEYRIVYYLHLRTADDDIRKLGKNSLGIGISEIRPFYISKVLIK